MTTREPVSPDQLEAFAEALQACAVKYRDMASDMRCQELASVELTGWKTLTKRTLKLLRGHVSRSVATLARQFEAKADAALATNPSRFVADESQVGKKARKAKRKPGE